VRAHAFAIPAQGDALLFEQPRDGRVPDLKFLLQFAREGGQSFARPFQTRNGIACGGIFQQFV
jgi:hypothetical protein